jgi:hypothetical protein
LGCECESFRVGCIECILSSRNGSIIARLICSIEGLLGFGDGVKGRFQCSCKLRGSSIGNVLGMLCLGRVSEGRAFISTCTAVISFTGTAVVSTCAAFIST